MVGRSRSGRARVYAAQVDCTPSVRDERVVGFALGRGQSLALCYIPRPLRLLSSDERVVVKGDEMCGRSGKLDVEKGRNVDVCLAPPVVSSRR